MTATAYPLSWPVGYPRTAHRRQSSFGTRSSAFASKRPTFARVRDLLSAELERLGASKIVLSTNLGLQLDGLPRSGQSMPGDPGVAVYFQLKGKALVLPSDKWDRVECNLMALVKHIEALRGLDRWGVGTVERNFAGYQALPEKGQGLQWYDHLKVPPDAPAELIEQSFKQLAKIAHPDAGGTLDRWHQLHEARQQGLAAARGNVS